MQRGHIVTSMPIRHDLRRAYCDFWRGSYLRSGIYCVVRWGRVAGREGEKGRGKWGRG